MTETFHGQAAVADFNLETDYTPDPLVPPATYDCNIVSSKYNEKGTALEIGVSIIDCDDTYPGTTRTITGARLTYRINLPLESHRSRQWSNGENAFTGTVRMMGQALQRLRLDTVRTPADIQQVISSGELLGQSATVRVTVREWEGNESNDVKWVKVSK